MEERRWAKPEGRPNAGSTVQGLFCIVDVSAVPSAMPGRSSDVMAGTSGAPI